MKNERREMIRNSAIPAVIRATEMARRRVMARHPEIVYPAGLKPGPRVPIDDRGHVIIDDPPAGHIGMRR